MTVKGTVTVKGTGKAGEESPVRFQQLPAARLVAGANRREQAVGFVEPPLVEQVLQSVFKLFVGHDDVGLANGNGATEVISTDVVRSPHRDDAIVAQGLAGRGEPMS